MKIKRIGIFIFDGVQLLDAAGPRDIFSEAGGYEIEFFSSTQSPIFSSCGARLTPEQVISRHIVDRYDTIIITGGVIDNICQDQELLHWLLLAAPPTCRRLASVCTGAFLLAAAGLLEGRRAVTHWQHCQKLATQYPGIKVEIDPIFIQSGPIWTSAGITAGLDMALAMVEEDQGRAHALTIARQFVLPQKRSGGQAQFAMALSSQFASLKHDKIYRSQEWMSSHLQRDIKLEEMAHIVGMSVRNFQRQFKKIAGKSPRQYLESLRIQHALRIMENPQMDLQSIASVSGFGSAEILRRTFHRHFGVAPDVFRQQFFRKGDKE